MYYVLHFDLTITLHVWCTINGEELHNLLSLQIKDK